MHVLLGIGVAAGAALTSHRLRPMVRAFVVPAANQAGQSGAAAQLGVRGLEPVAGMSAGLVAVVRGPGWDTAAFAALCVVGSALAVVDIAVRRLPNRLTLPLWPIVTLLLAVAACARHQFAPLGRAGVGMLALTGGYGALFALRPDEIGAGDVKLAGPLGLVLGWLGWRALLLGSFAGLLLASAHGMGLLLTRGRGLTATLPLGPFMLVGGWLAMLGIP